jgi:phosphoribosylcarboxyaminoimidazole (NCAIR) mutase
LSVANDGVKPLVGIIMGSDSDLPVMSESARMLDKFGIPYEIEVVSARRRSRAD